MPRAQAWQAQSWSKVCQAVEGLELSLILGERMKGEFLRATATVPGVAFDVTRRSACGQGSCRSLGRSRVAAVGLVLVGGQRDEQHRHRCRRAPAGPQHPRDVAARYGPWQTVYGLFRRWQRDGTWTRILTRLQAQAMWTPSGALANFVSGASTSVSWARSRVGRKPHARRPKLRAPR